MLTIEQHPVKTYQSREFAKELGRLLGKERAATARDGSAVLAQCWCGRSACSPRSAARWIARSARWTPHGAVAARRHLCSPELQERVTKQWNDLLRDVEAALGDDPASERAQALVARWRALVEAFTGGDPEIQKGLNRMYSDMPQWPAQRRTAFGIRPEIQAFITKATQAAASR